MNLMMNADALY